MFIARVEVFLPSSYTKMCPVVLGTLACRCCLFLVSTLIRCRNLREPPQDLRVRDFQWLSDFFSPNICVAKFQSNFFFVYYCFFIPSFFCLLSTANLNLSDQMQPIQFGINCSASNQSEASIYGSSNIKGVVG